MLVSGSSFSSSSSSSTFPVTPLHPPSNETKVSSASLFRSDLVPSVEFFLRIPPKVKGSEAEIKAYKENPPSNALNKLPRSLLLKVFKTLGGVGMYTFRMCSSERYTDNMTDWLHCLSGKKSLEQWGAGNEMEQIKVALVNPHSSIKYCPPSSALYNAMRSQDFSSVRTGTLRWIKYGNKLGEELSDFECQILALRIDNLVDLVLLRGKPWFDPSSNEELEEAERKAKAAVKESFAITGYDASENEFASDPGTILSLIKIINHSYELDIRNQEYSNWALIKLCFAMVKADRIHLMNEFAALRRKAAGVCHEAILKGWGSKLLHRTVVDLLHSHGYFKPDPLPDNMQKFYIDFVNTYSPLPNSIIEQQKRLLLAHREKVVSLNAMSIGCLDAEFLESFPSLVRLSAWLDSPLPRALHAKIKELHVRFQGRGSPVFLEGEMPCLERLSLVRNRASTFDLVAPELKYLYLRDCQITSFPTLNSHANLHEIELIDQEISQMVGQMPSVRKVLLGGGDQLTSEDLRERFPNLMQIIQDGREVWSNSASSSTSSTSSSST